MSQIVSPNGEVLALAGKETEEVGIVEINPAEAEDKYLTPLNHLFFDRRPEFYRELLEG
jgi:predicted amidohydrolase